MKPHRIELPADLPLVALQGFLREHGLELRLLGGTDKHRDYTALRTEPQPHLTDDQEHTA